jgi:hypothetical protein
MTFAWHVHHEILCEMLTEPIKNRIFYIKKTKPEGEIELRLRLLKPVQHPERLPIDWQEAYQKRLEADQKWKEAYQKRQEADQKRQEAYQKWQEAYQKWKEADQKSRSEIEALHSEECPNCPWNGRTIFVETLA